MIRATAVEIKLKKKRRKKRLSFPNVRLNGHLPNQGVWCQSISNRWWKLVVYIHSFFPAVSILSWNLRGELHVSVETG